MKTPQGCSPIERVTIQITQTIQLERCWVCPSTIGLHDHHVVPQSYGGTDGPQVTLCGGHHTLIHAMSLKRKDKWTFEGSELQRAKLLYLTSVIARARAATKHLNRPMQLSNKIDIERRAKLRAIQKVRGLSSIQATLEYLIDVGYDLATPLKRSIR